MSVASLTFPAIERARLRLQCFQEMAGWGIKGKDANGEDTFKTYNFTERMEKSEELFQWCMNDAKK